MYFVHPDFGQTLFWTLYMYMCVIYSCDSL